VARAPSGKSLEPDGNARPRGMTASLRVTGDDRIRLTDLLQPHSETAEGFPARVAHEPSTVPSRPSSRQSFRSRTFRCSRARPRRGDSTTLRGRIPRHWQITRAEPSRLVCLPAAAFPLLGSSRVRWAAPRGLVDRFGNRLLPWTSLSRGHAQGTRCAPQGQRR
jgi:hypothetical protein